MSEPFEPFVMRDLEYIPGLTLDVYRPDDDVATLRPSLLFLHGGSFHGGDKADARSVAFCTALAAAGYAMVSANYSLGSGPGRDERWDAWPQSLLDCRAALEFIWGEQYRIGADSRLVGAMGVSAGATMALVLGLVSDDELAEIAFEGGLVPEHSVTPAVRVVVNLYGRVDFANDTVPERRPTSDERTRLISPLTYVTPGKRLPFLLTIHGTDDEIVPFSQARLLHDAIVDVDEDHELWRMHGAGHDFGTSVNGHELPSRIVGYLQRVFA